jgi:hypothetical protein
MSEMLMIVQHSPTAETLMPTLYYQHASDCEKSGAHSSGVNALSYCCMYFLGRGSWCFPRLARH